MTEPLQPSANFSPQSRPEAGVEVCVWAFAVHSGGLLLINVDQYANQLIALKLEPPSFFSNPRLWSPGLTLSGVAS